MSTGSPPWLAIVMMLTMLPPPPARRISRAASCMSRNGARALTANSRSHSSTLVSSSVPRLLSPAALTSPSRRPKRSSQARDDRAAVASSARSAGDEDRLGAERGELLAHRLAARGVAPADDDAGGAEPRGAAGDRGAEALGAAGDDDDLAVEALVGEQVRQSRRHLLDAHRPALAQRAPRGQADDERRTGVGRR